MRRLLVLAELRDEVHDPVGDRASSSDPRISGADLYGLELADLINVRDVLNPPPTPWRPVVLTALLVALALLVSVTGLGSNEREGTLEAGQVVIGGIDVRAVGGAVEANVRILSRGQVIAHQESRGLGRFVCSICIMFCRNDVSTVTPGAETVASKERAREP